VARTSPIIGELTYTFTPSFRSMYLEEHVYLGDGCWSWYVLGRTCKLCSTVWVLVGVLRLLVYTLDLFCTSI
jgi:hypothetical protein